MDAPPGLRLAQRQQADDAVRRVAVAGERAQEQVGRVAGADQQHRLRAGGDGVLSWSSR